MYTYRSIVAIITSVHFNVNVPGTAAGFCGIHRLVCNGRQRSYRLTHRGRRSGSHTTSGKWKSRPWLLGTHISRPTGRSRRSLYCFSLYLPSTLTRARVLHGVGYFLIQLHTIPVSSAMLYVLVGEHWPRTALSNTIHSMWLCRFISIYRRWIFSLCKQLCWAHGSTAGRGMSLPKT